MLFTVLLNLPGAYGIRVIMICYHKHISFSGPIRVCWFVRGLFASGDPVRPTAAPTAIFSVSRQTLYQVFLFHYSQTQ